MNVYLIATNDKYELPLFIGNLQQCADYLGENYNSFACGMYRINSGETNLYKKKKIFKFKESELED